MRANRGRTKFQGYAVPTQKQEQIGVTGLTIFGVAFLFGLVAGHWDPFSWGAEWGPPMLVVGNTFLAMATLYALTQAWSSVAIEDRNEHIVAGEKRYLRGAVAFAALGTFLGMWGAVAGFSADVPYHSHDFVAPHVH